MATKRKTRSMLEDTPSVMLPEQTEKPLLERLAPVLLLLVVVMAFAMGMMWSKLNNKSTSATTTAPPPAPKISINQVKELWDKDLIKFGDAKKKVLFVEVADPSCPYCHVAGGKNPELNKQIGDRFKLSTDGGTYIAPVPEMKKLVDEGKAAYIYIYSPGHGNGEMGTKAMMCAHEKGRFWEVHDFLMTSQGYSLLNDVVKNDKTKADTLVQFLKPVIDADQLRGCLESGRYDARMSSDPALASSLGTTGTPGFFINDTSFAGAYSWADMKPKVDEALKKWF